MKRRELVPTTRQLGRLREIATVLVKYGFGDVLARLHLEPSVALGRRLLTPRGREVERLTRAQRIRSAAEELGPTFVKFGQALATRADILSPALVTELARLQDQVAPVSFAQVEASVNAEFGAPLTTLFHEFDPVPVAAASIAQVHRARLASGEEVAVKIRRPGIERVIESDLAILAHLARLMERYVTDARLLGPTGLVDEFARAIRREQDLAREGRTIERFARDFAGDGTVRLPRVYWACTSRAMLTLEYMHGVSLSQVLAGEDGRIDRPLVARRGAAVVLAQVLRHGLFHADLHPANILVLPEHVICMLDFGNVGSLDRATRERLAGLAEAIVRQDLDRAVASVLAITRTNDEVDTVALRRDVGDILDAYAGVTLSRLSIGELLGDLFSTMARHQLRFPSDLMLLAKTLVTMEGVGRQLDPSFQLIEHAAPLVEQVLRERYSPSAIAGRLADLGRDATAALHLLPRELAEIVHKARSDRLQVQFVHRNLEHLVQEIDRASNRLAFAIVIAALIVGSSLIFRQTSGPTLFGYPALGLLGFVVAGLLGLWLVIGILRSGRV
jgi:ubiquinone biosynthesis protein